MDQLEQLGSKAYQQGLWGDYKGAISILNKAITRHPCDPRLYNNRSYYHFKLKQYNEALNDAESMLKLFPTYAKGYFRKAEVLLEFKRYEEAEEVFRDTLKLDPTNEEVEFWILEAQTRQLTDDGKYLLVDVKTALELNNYNSTQAKQFLTVGGMTDTNSYERDDVYYSDDDLDIPSAKAHVDPPITKVVRSIDTPLESYDPLTDPYNPLNSNSLWVGNVTKAINAKHLETIFSKYGKILNIVVQHQQRCAFVNYTHPRMATNAMRTYPQMIPVEDTFLVIKFPESAKIKRPAHLGKTSVTKKK